MSSQNKVHFSFLVFFMATTACRLDGFSTEQDPKTGREVVNIQGFATCEVDHLRYFETQTVKEGDAFPFKCRSTSEIPLKLEFKYKGTTSIKTPPTQAEEDQQKGFELVLEESSDGGTTYTRVSYLDARADLGQHEFRRQRLPIDIGFTVSLPGTTSSYYGRIVLTKCHWGSSRECSFHGERFEVTRP